MDYSKHDVFAYLAKHWEQLGFCLWRDRYTYPKLEGFDLDVLAEPRPWSHTVAQIDGLVGDLGWSIVTYVCLGQRMTCLLAADSCRPDEDDGFLQLDVERAVSIAGVPFASAREVISRSEIDRGIRWVSRVDGAVIDFLAPTLAGETPKSRYLERWRDMIEEQADGMKHALTEAVGEEHAKALVSGQELDAVTLRKAYVRTAVRLRSFEMAKILAAKLRNGTAAYLRPAGRVWAFSGPDGSGKTTLIDALAAFATRRVMVSTARFHTRPFLLPRLNAFVPMSSEKRRVLETERDVPERSNTAKSFIRLLYALVDYNLGYWFKVRPQLAKGNLVVFDRYYQDFLVDSHRRGIALPQWILDTCARFVPKPDRHVFVLAKGEALAARKGELDALEGDDQSVRYRHLATTVGSPVVIDTDNADPKDLAATLALTLIADLRTDRAKANTNPEQPS